jgi:hypothetical protein
MCASFFFNMKAGTETTLATHNEPSNGPTVVPTPSQGPEDVQQVISVFCLCLYLYCLGSICSFDCAIIFEVEMMFSMVLINTKVVDNYLILVVINFHVPRSDGL